jgi:hypothetical protein
MQSRTRRRRGALGIGLAITAAAFVLLQFNAARPIPSGEGGIYYTDAHPHRLDLSLPGVFVILLAVNFTPIMWGQHPVLAQVVAAAGNFVFYSLAAYLMLCVTAGLSTSWRRR